MTALLEYNDLFQRLNYASNFFQNASIIPEFYSSNHYAQNPGIILAPLLCCLQLV